MTGKKKRIKPTYKMQFRRRREGRTDYKRRLTLLKSRLPRLVVRRSLNYIRAQIVEYEKDGDKTIASAMSSELKAMGWGFACDSMPAAYLTGLLVGKRAKEKKIAEVVLDSGLYPSTKGSRVYAVVKGVLDSGIVVPHNDEVMPDEGRITGAHIANYRNEFKEIPTEFKKVKQKIMS